jgi:hypothetical protein
MVSGESNWEAAKCSVPEQYILTISEHIHKHGLDSLYWLSGTYTQEMASAMHELLTELMWEKSLAPSDGSFCILLRPEETRLVEVFARYPGCIVGSMTGFCIDSFLVVNKSAVLDVTPVIPAGGIPKFDTDSTMVSLYVGLFNMLQNRSTIIAGPKLGCAGMAAHS